MITNERQYRITRSKARGLAAALSDLNAASSPQPKVHKRLLRAQREALESQMQDLESELADYERLKCAGPTGITLHSFDELPEGLIRARIAAGLSQRSLAERLGLTAQQIQRYEAERYRSASYRRLCEVSRALGIRIRNEILLPHVPADFDGLLAKLAQVGLDREFVLERLLPAGDAELASEESSEAGADTVLTARTVPVLERVVGWTPAQLMSAEPLATTDLGGESVRFKKFGRRESQATTVFETYAGFLARIVARGMGPEPSEPIPSNPLAMRKRIRATYGSDDFASILRAIWDLGVAVLPLQGPRTFHAACWRHDGRNVIVLNQRSPFESRWAFDLLHELHHAAQQPEALSIGTGSDSSTRAKERLAKEEAAASRFAADVMLDGGADELAELCLERGTGTAGLLKDTVSRVASMHDASVAALANYVAFRLSIEGIYWWQAAADLQVTISEPWAVARDLFVERFAYRIDSDIDRALIDQALRGGNTEIPGAYPSDN